MSQEPVWKDYDNKTDAEKAIAYLRSIDDNLSSLYCKLHEIDEKLLHSQSVTAAKKINDTLVAMGGYFLVFGIIVIFLLYKISSYVGGQ